MKSFITSEFIKDSPKLRFQQGDILRDISIIAGTDFDNETGEIIVSAISLEYAVVVNQDCDLEHDYNSRKESNNKDKFLPNILLVPAYLASKFKEGAHLGEDHKCQVWNSQLYKPIIQNLNQRFHYLNSNEQFQIPELIIDFKHVYTINRDIIYKNINLIYLASICELYRENLSHRYSNFISRIGLPDRET